MLTIILGMGYGALSIVLIFSPFITKKIYDFLSPSKKKNKIYREYHLNEKRNYQIEMFDGSIMEVKEEDFWLNTRGCYDHGYADPIPVVNLMKPCQSPGTRHYSRTVYPENDSEFFEDNVKEYVYAMGGLGNRRLIGWTRGSQLEKDEYE